LVGEAAHTPKILVAMMAVGHSHLYTYRVMAPMVLAAK
jgi:hypothetical protein